jgi:hypothetical protein
MLRPLPFDITNLPELVKIAEEVEATKIPRELKRKNKTVAVLVPAKGTKPVRKPREKTKADYEAFKAAAGSWKDVDVEKFKADIYASRRLSTRPPVKL